MNPVYILGLSAESQSDITRCLYNTKQNICMLPIVADPSSIQYIHRGDLPKEWHWQIFNSATSFLRTWLWIWKKCKKKG